MAVKYSPILAGIDGGSSQTRLLLADSKGTILGRAIGGPSNCGLVSPDDLAANYQRMFAAAAKQAGLQKIDFTYIGSAGVVRAEDASALEAIVRRVSFPALGQVRVVNDNIIGLAGGVGRTDAIALIAGTGSACYGHDPSGRSWQAGGWEHLVDDRGSAYRIALEGLVASVRAADGRGPGTMLQDRFFAALGIDSLAEIVARLHYPDAGQPPVEKTFLASLATHVFVCAEARDPVASEILDREIAELAHMVTVVAEKLTWSDEVISLVLIGSIANHPQVKGALAARLSRAEPRVQIIAPVLSPEGGALFLAAEMAGLQPGPDFTAQVRRSVLSTE